MKVNHGFYQVPEGRGWSFTVMVLRAHIGVGWKHETHAPQKFLYFKNIVWLDWAIIEFHMGRLMLGVKLKGVKAYK